LETQIKSPMGRRLVLREVTKPGQDGREWTIDDRAADLHFKALLSRRSLHGTPPGWVPLKGEPGEDDVLLAVGHAVDNAIVALRAEAQRGVCYDISVNSQEVYEAREMAGRIRPR
jgi:hypothetical protein